MVRCLRYLPRRLSVRVVTTGERGGQGLDQLHAVGRYLPYVAPSYLW